MLSRSGELRDLAPRSEREQQRDEQRRAGAERGDAPIEVEREAGRHQPLRKRGRRDAQQHGGHDEPRHPADGGEQEILRRELAHETPAIRAEHGPDRELVAASGVACQQQVRDVREADEQHETDHAEKEQ